jgi:aryl-alcohol dehydrogenase-like predicted oxidoreductase
MEYRTLGKTGIQISYLSLGTMTFGSAADEEMSGKIFNRCREAGINVFDTANIYGGNRNGRGEQIVGRLIKSCRDELILSTKVGTPRWGGPNDGGLSRRYIMLEVEKSLKNLQTDRIDIYYIHKLDSRTPMEETLRAMDDLQKQGKILYPAISNSAAWQIALALGISREESIAEFACVQPMYNLVKRQSEVEILELAKAEKLGVITYSPLGAGLLTGKYTHGDKPEEGRIRTDERYKARYGNPLYFEIAEKFVDYAAEHGVKPAALAVAWAASHPAVTSSLIGARNLEQLEDSLAAIEIKMTPEWRKEIDSLSVEPPPATDRSEEKN